MGKKKFFRKLNSLSEILIHKISLLYRSNRNCGIGNYPFLGTIYEIIVRCFIIAKINTHKFACCKIFPILDYQLFRFYQLQR